MKDLLKFQIASDRTVDAVACISLGLLTTVIGALALATSAAATGGLAVCAFGLAAVAVGSWVWAGSRPAYFAAALVWAALAAFVVIQGWKSPADLWSGVLPLLSAVYYFLKGRDLSDDQRPKT